MFSRRIVDFYEALRRLDAAAMQAAYAPNARFSDPMFRLRGADEIGAMWTMLCSSIQRCELGEWHIEVNDIEATARRGRARWEPKYRIRASNRPVHKIVDADFVFDKDGRIVSHTERFGFWRWSHQALGLRGTLLGWSPLLRAQLRAQARRSLQVFMQPYAPTLQLMPAEQLSTIC